MFVNVSHLRIGAISVSSIVASTQDGADGAKRKRVETSGKATRCKQLSD